MPQNVDIYNWTAYGDGLYRSADQSAALDTAVTTVWNDLAVDDDHGNAGYITFSTSRVEMSSTGNAQIAVERVAGFAGAVSVDLSTYNTTGDIAMNSTTHFTAVTSKTISFADQEAGKKYINVAVTTAPAAGLHMLGVTMDTAVGGVGIRHSECHVYFDDGGLNTSATSVTSATASTLETTINAAAAGDLIYVRDTSGVYTYNNRTGGEAYGGYTITNTAGLKTAPIIVRNYPGESPVIDQVNAGTSDTLGNNVTVGFLVRATTKYMHIGGIEIKNCRHCGVIYGGVNNNNVVEDSHIHDLAKLAIGNYTLSSHADNIGGVRIDDCVDFIGRNNEIHNIYDPRTGTGTSNPFDAEPYSLHSGYHGYRPKNAWIEHNKLYNVNDGIYHKQPHQLVTGGADGHHVNNNWFYNIIDYGVHISTAGSGAEPSHNILVHNNVAELDNTTGTDVALVGLIYAGDIITQPTGMTIWNNTQIGGDWLYYMRTMSGVNAYNNILDGVKNNIAIEADNLYSATWNNQIIYHDWNDYYNITSTGFTTRRNGTAKTYTSLATWQTAYSVDTNTDTLDADPDANAITTVPTYVNSGTKDFRTTSGNTFETGRFGRSIGIGSEVVGVS